MNKWLADPVRILQTCILLFASGFLILGQGSGNKGIVWINFGLDVILCAVFTWMVFRLWKSETSYASRIGWSLLDLFLIFFTWFAFLAPEAGLPPVLFA